MAEAVQISTGKAIFSEIEVAMVVLNEQDLIYNAILNVYDYVDGIVIIDGGSTDNTIEVIKSFPDAYSKIHLYKNKFSSFGDQKNLAISKTNSLWTLVLDADEILSPLLLKDLRKLLRANQNKDVLILDRKNFVDGKSETNAIEKQFRLFKSFCRYVSIVHEELVGWRQELSVVLPEQYHIIHNKTLNKYKNNQLIFLSLKEKNPHKDNSLSRLISYEIIE